MSTDHSKSLFKQAINEIMATNFVGAEMLLQQAAEHNDEGTSLYSASLATLLIMRDRADEAIELLEKKLEEASTDSNLLMAYGFALEKQENYEDAEDAFRESLVNDPISPGAIRGLAVCLARRGRVLESSKLAARAFTLAPDNLLLAETAADFLEKADKKDLALEVLELGAHHNSDSEDLVSRAIIALMSRGETERVKRIMILLDETQAWAAGWKANFLDWQSQTDHANELIQKTLRRPAGQDIEFLFQLCCILMRRGEVGAVEAYVNHILEKDPQHQGANAIKADFAIGRFEYNPAVDPLISAVVASKEIPGWARFWSLIKKEEFESVEETLAQMAEMEAFTTNPAEMARMELAEHLYLLLSSEEERGEPQMDALEQLPSETCCGLCLEFLEVLDVHYSDLETAEDFRTFLNQLLTQKNPALQLNRLYAQSHWEELTEALDDLESLEPEEGQELDKESIKSLYGTLLSLGTEVEGAVENFDFEESPQITGSIFNTLFQKGALNPTELRFMDKLQGQVIEIQTPKAPEILDLPEVEEEGPKTFQVGGVIDTKDVEVIYETEDGEVIEDFDEDEYEVVAETEIDEDGNEVEYVWVEEEEEDEEPESEPQEPQDTY